MTRLLLPPPQRPHPASLLVRLGRGGLLGLLLALASTLTLAQSDGQHTLYGDLKVEEGQAVGLKPISYEVTLYTEGGNVVNRLTIGNHGRFRFLNLNNGNYDIAVAVDNNEVARVRVYLSSPYKNDFRQDLALEWKPGPGTKGMAGGRGTSVVDVYQRSAANSALYVKAQEALEKKSYDRSLSLFQQLLASDPRDYQAWSELGTLHLLKESLAEAEKAYERAVEVKPDYAPGWLNLGRVRLLQKNFEGAVEALDRSVKNRPDSAAAHYYLGEAYLQMKKGSKAVGYLYEALRLDPQGRAEAHLRLAALYHGAGLKEKAAAEYEQFLLKRPAYAERKRLEQYIAENKKP